MINIKEYGFKEFYENQISKEELERGFIPARVISIQKETYRVISREGENNSKLKGSIFYQNSAYQTYPAVGDFVLIRANKQGDDIIYRVLERYSSFSRVNPSLRSQVTGAGEQIVASNFDYVFIMLSLNNDFNLRRAERYLATAWQSGGTPVFVLTKADLCSEYEDSVTALSVIAPGVDIHAVSAHTGFGMEQLEKYFSPGKTLVFLGSSGIGKSSLVNALAKAELMKVNTIREDDSKGQHTTTYRQLFKLDNGCLVIDTPGMRELGVWDVEEGLEEVFTDIEALSATCRFYDCSHKSEPGCAIKEALKKGTLSEERFKSYIKLKKEAAYSAQKAAALVLKKTPYQNKTKNRKGY